MSTPNLSNTSKSYLFQISIPIFFSNIAIPFVGLVDTGLMGHLNSERYLAAISIATSVISLVFWSFGFLRMGTVGLVSQSLGRNNYNDIALIILKTNAAATPNAIIFFLFSGAKLAATKPIMIALSAAITMSINIICSNIIGSSRDILNFLYNLIV